MPKFISFMARNVVDERSPTIKLVQGGGERSRHLVDSFLKDNVEYTVESVESLVYNGKFQESFPVSPEAVKPRKWPANRAWAPVADVEVSDDQSNIAAQ